MGTTNFSDLAADTFTGNVVGNVTGSALTAPVNLTAGATLGASHQGRLITVNAAAGAALVLPAASGTGARFRVLMGTTVTSNTTTIKVANATDVMTGMALVAQDAGDTVVVFETAASSDTITMNGSTTGGIKGDYIELEDAAAGLWRVLAHMSGTGTEATPFSATVS